MAGPGPGWPWQAVSPSSNGPLRSPTRSHFEKLASRHGIPKALVAEIVDQVRGAIADWPRFAGSVGVLKASTQEIADRCSEIERAFRV